MPAPDLAARMREAAETLREANALYSFQPEYGMWNPKALENEAAVVASEVTP